jgi:hypothetical protein
VTPWRAGVLLLALIALPLLASARLQTDEPNRAVVVVRAGDELVESRCIAFTEESISGYELLSRSGLNHVVNPTGAGVMVCSIVGEGCPAQNCLCQCQGEPCTYWSYWRWGDEGWQYAGLGASVTQIVNGRIDGWSWGPSSVTNAIEPPTVDFAEVCRDAGPGVATAAGVTAEPATAWLPYALFLLFAALLGGALLILRRRKTL